MNIIIFLPNDLSEGGNARPVRIELVTKTMKKKPKLSFWQIWNLSFGFLGVQIGYSLQNSNTSSILQSLGADLSHLSYFWLAAPIAGLIIQPIVGMFSDGTWTRFGRRIPYILGGAIISTIALLLMPNCPTLLAFARLRWEPSSSCSWTCPSTSRCSRSGPS